MKESIWLPRPRFLKKHDDYSAYAVIAPTGVMHITVWTIYASSMFPFFKNRFRYTVDSSTGRVCWECLKTGLYLHPEDPRLHALDTARFVAIIENMLPGRILI